MPPGYAEFIRHLFLWLSAPLFLLAFGHRRQLRDSYQICLTHLLEVLTGY